MRENHGEQEIPPNNTFNGEFDFGRIELPDISQEHQEPVSVREILESRANNDGLQSVVIAQYDRALEDRFSMTKPEEALTIVAKMGIATHDDELAHFAFLEQGDVGKWETWAYAVKNGNTDLADSPAWKTELSFADQNKNEHHKISESKIEGTAHLWASAKGEERAELGLKLSELVDNVEPSPGHGSTRYDRTKGIAYDLMENGAFTEAEKIINGQTRIEIDGFMEKDPLDNALPLFKAMHGQLSWNEARKLKNDTDYPAPHKQVLNLINARTSNGKKEAASNVRAALKDAIMSRHQRDLNPILDKISPESAKYKDCRIDEGSNKAIHTGASGEPEPNQIRSFFKAEKPEAAVSYWHSVVDQAAKLPGMQPPKSIECTVAMLENKQEVDKLAARREIEFIDLKVQLGFAPFPDGTIASEVLNDPTNALLKLIDVADGMPDLRQRLVYLKEAGDIYSSLSQSRRINNTVGEKLEETIVKANRTNQTFGLTS